MPAPISTASANARHLLRNAVLPEPLDQLRPRVCGGGLVVAGTIIGEESVSRLGIDDDLGILARVVELLPHALDLIERDAAVLAAIQAEHRRLHLPGDVESGSRPILILQSEQLAVPCNAGLQPGAVRRVKPHRAA